MSPNSEPRPLARSVVELAEVDSTSNLARALVAEPQLELPLLVRAGRQTAGRGRGDRRWFSDAGSLTFTLALDPSALGLRPEHMSRVALASALAVVEATSPPLPVGAAGIRWPNDVEVAGRKLAGILPEVVQTPAGPRLLVGIGLNVATRFDDAPAEVRRLATSLAREAGAAPDPSEVLRRILDRLGRTLEALACDDANLPDRWAALDTLRGRPIAIEQAGAVERGVGAGIAPDGSLRLADERGVRSIVGGSVLREGR